MKYIFFMLVLFIVSISLLHAQDTAEVSSGWNMIGVSSRVAQNEIRTEPSGIITSYFFGYNSGVGYTQTDTLKKNKGYWVKASQAGLLLWGSSSSFLCGTSTVPYGGKTYNTIQIGTQCWLRENLDVGTMLQGTDTSKNNGIIEKYCYGNNTANCSTYGGLYQWNEAMQYSVTEGSQGICPPGWHIPTLTEFQTLNSTVNGDGNTLKAIGQGSGSGVGTNTSGFSALIAGLFGTEDYFVELGVSTGLWSSSDQMMNEYAFYLILPGSDTRILQYNTYKVYGFSVRCLKD